MSALTLGSDILHDSLGLVGLLHRGQPTQGKSTTRQREKRGERDRRSGYRSELKYTCSYDVDDGLF